MAKVKRVEYGSDRISLFAEDGQYDLVIGEDVVACAKTRREMVAKINAIRNDLHDIQWELDRDYGMFKEFDLESEEKPKEAETE